MGINHRGDPKELELEHQREFQQYKELQNAQDAAQAEMDAQIEQNHQHYMDRQKKRQKTLHEEDEIMEARRGRFNSDTVDTLNLNSGFHNFRHNWLQLHSDQYYLKQQARKATHRKTLTPDTQYNITKDILDPKNITYEFGQQYGFHLAWQKSCQYFIYPPDNSKRKTKTVNLETKKIYFRPEDRCDDNIVDEGCSYHCYDIYQGMYTNGRFMMVIPNILLPIYFPMNITLQLNEYRGVFKGFKKNWEESLHDLKTVIFTPLDKVTRVEIPCQLDVIEGGTTYLGLYRAFPVEEADHWDRSPTNIRLEYYNFLPKTNIIYLQAYYKKNSCTDQQLQFLLKKTHTLTFYEKELDVPCHVVKIEHIFEWVLLTFTIDFKHVYKFKKFSQPIHPVIFVDIPLELTNINHNNRDFARKYYANHVNMVTKNIMDTYMTKWRLNQNIWKAIKSMFHTFLLTDRKSMLQLLFIHYRSTNPDFTDESILKEYFENWLKNNECYINPPKYILQKNNTMNIIDLATQYFHVYLEQLIKGLGIQLFPHCTYEMMKILFCGVCYTIDQTLTTYDAEAIKHQIRHWMILCRKLKFEDLQFPPDIVDFPTKDLISFLK